MIKLFSNWVGILTVNLKIIKFVILIKLKKKKNYVRYYAFKFYFIDFYDNNQYLFILHS